MTSELAEAIRLLQQSRRELEALVGGEPIAPLLQSSDLFATLLDVADASARHDAAIQEIRSRLEAVERLRRSAG